METRLARWFFSENDITALKVHIRDAEALGITLGAAVKTGTGWVYAEVLGFDPTNEAHLELAGHGSCLGIWWYLGRTLPQGEPFTLLT